MEHLPEVLRVLRASQGPAAARPERFRFRFSAEKDGRLQSRKSRRGSEKEAASLSQVF